MASQNKSLSAQQSLSSTRQILRWGYRHLPLSTSLKRGIWRRIQILKMRSNIQASLRYANYIPKLSSNNPDDIKGRIRKLYFPQHQNNIDISIIIPCYNQLRYTIHCLQSLIVSPSRAKCEIIVVNDASPHDDYSLLNEVPGLVLIHNKNNLGYLKSCNKAAKIAKGKFIYLLNNDTCVTNGSIDQLIDTFSKQPNAGLVGSKLMYPNGILQEAGGIVWKDGSAWNYGRFEIGHEPQYNYLRSVDYCSAASVMIPRDLFITLGGFDAIYQPAYYEDTDLAMKIRQSGRDVLYQPKSEIIHFEGVSHGTDTSQGLKKHQLINQNTFKTRWKEKLGDHRSNGVEPEHEKDRNFNQRVLLIDKCTPSPDRDAGSVVLLNLMLMLRHLGYQPTFIPDDNYAFVEPYTPLSQSLGIECLYAPHVKNVRQHVKKQGQRYDLVILFRPDLTTTHLDTIRKYCPKAKIIYYPHDLHFVRMTREGSLLNKKHLLKYAEKSRAIEFDNTKKSDCTIVVSTNERDQLRSYLPESRIDFLPLVFSEKSECQKMPCFGKTDMVFIGNFNHTPNADAVRWFAKDILPLITRQLPDARFHIVGANPPRDISELSSESIIIHGFVHDLDALLGTMSLSVVPLRFGAGMKGKVGSALRCGLPVVSTSIGCEGMCLSTGEGAIIADNSDSFADAVIKALSSQGLWNELSERGKAACEKLWGKQAAIDRFKHILSNLGLPTDNARSLEHLKLYPFDNDWPLG